MTLFNAKLDEIKLKAASLKSIRGIANVLEIKYASLIYYIRKVSEADKYTKFCIPKKSGGEREIYAPIPPLRFIQKKMNFVLQSIFSPHYCVHGFVYDKNIVTNAQCHVKQKNVLNIDLKDFFPSINFGRVRGIFMVYPFNFNSTVATFLAQICCYNNQLPQGAPTSPIISNFICAKLDRQLLDFSRENNCKYTRYADDLTFSTYLPKLSRLMLISDPDIQQNAVILADELKKIITDNGFEINERKIRLRTWRQKQEVTGLTVNKFPNVSRKLIRQVRAMLYAWQKFGLDKAEEEYFARYSKSHRNPETKKPSFQDIVIGKINYIGMVRGKEDKIYRGFCKKLKDINPKLKMKVKLTEQEKTPLIITEGSSDWKHLKAAFRNLKKLGFFLDLKLEFSEYRGSMGGEHLQLNTRIKQTETLLRQTIFVFDSDNSKIVKEIVDYKGNPRYWGNNVYSFCLPTPQHRISEPGVYIELYYTDDEIKTEDAKGRRLFFNNEFDPLTRKHVGAKCYCSVESSSKLKKTQLIVLDSYNIEEKYRVALSKNNFADLVLKGEGKFGNFNFLEFKKIFEIIETIIEKAKEHY